MEEWVDWFQQEKEKRSVVEENDFIVLLSDCKIRFSYKLETMDFELQMKSLKKLANLQSPLYSYNFSCTARSLYVLWLLDTKHSKVSPGLQR